MFVIFESASCQCYKHIKQAWMIVSEWVSKKLEGTTHMNISKIKIKMKINIQKAILVCIKKKFESTLALSSTNPIH